MDLLVPGLTCGVQFSPICIELLVTGEHGISSRGKLITVCHKFRSFTFQCCLFGLILFELLFKAIAVVVELFSISFELRASLSPTLLIFTLFLPTGVQPRLAFCLNFFNFVNESIAFTAVLLTISKPAIAF